MTLGRGGVLCWRLVQSVVLIAYCGCGRGADWGDQSTWLRGIFGAVGGGVDLFPGDQGGWPL